MGILSFLRRKKKEEGLAMPVPSIEKLELGLPGIEKKGIPETPALPSLPPLPSLPSAPELSFKEFTVPRDVSKDIELISAKLDAIKSMIENLSHRLERIEQQQKPKEREVIRW